MRHAITLAVLAAGFTCATGAGAFEPFKDFIPGKEVHNVVFVKVDPNRIDDYLEGLKATWWSGCEVGRKLGEIKRCAIYVSTTPMQSDFNMMLVQTYASGADLDPDETKYNRYMSEMRKQLEKAKQDKIVEGYNEMRTFYGEREFREITFK